MQSFLTAVAERSLAPADPDSDRAPKEAALAPAAAAACRASVAALAAGDPEEALAAAEAALVMCPQWPLAWGYRATALNELQLYADVLASVPCMQYTGAPWEVEGGRAQSALQSLFQQLPEFMGRTACADQDDRNEAWSELAAMDPTSLHARSAVYGHWVEHAARMRDKEKEARSSGTDGPTSGEDGEEGGVTSTVVATKALACLTECAADATVSVLAASFAFPLSLYTHAADSPHGHTHRHSELQRCTSCLL